MWYYLYDMKPLVCVIAHPDDEAFGPSGSLAYFATKRDVYIICVTRGDSDAKFTKHDPNSLAARREKELLTSANILGVKEVRFLNFKDGSLCNNNYHEVAAAIQKELEAIQPETVMTFELNGISGHLDHVAVALTTTYAVYKIPSVKTILYLRTLESQMKLERGNYFVYTPPGFTKEECDLVINTAPYWEKRLEAMNAHQSQAEDIKRILTLMSGFPKEEYFRVMKK